MSHNVEKFHKLERINEGVYLHGIDTPGQWEHLPSGQWTVAGAIQEIYELFRDRDYDKISRKEVNRMTDQQEARLQELQNKSRSDLENTVYYKLLELDEAQEQLDDAQKANPNPVPDPVQVAQDRVQKAAADYTAAEAALAASTGTVPPTLGTTDQGTTDQATAGQPTPPSGGQAMAPGTSADQTASQNQTAPGTTTPGSDQNSGNGDQGGGNPPGTPPAGVVG